MGTKSSEVERVFVNNFSTTQFRYKQYTGVVEDGNGTIRWLFNGFLHREDGPALIRKNGLQAWLVSGAYHRKDGPAIEWGSLHDFRMDFYRYGTKVSPLEIFDDLLDEYKEKVIWDLDKWRKNERS